MMLKRFLVEVLHFSRTNWWVYIIYGALLAIVFITNRDRLISVTAISFLHFVADIFIMMMLSAYSRGSYPQGSIFQAISMSLFLCLKLYTGFVGGGWHYLAADPIYFLAAFKNYKIDVRKQHVDYINRNSMTVLSIIILLCLIYSREYWGASIFLTPAQWIQTFGIFAFAIGLATTNERQRYVISVLALSSMVCGSAWETYDAIINNRLTGLALSYALLPLTVLVFYVRHWEAFKR